MHLQVRENCRCVYAEASVTWGWYLKGFISKKLCPLHCRPCLPSFSVIPSLQSLPWLCNCSAGGAAVLIEFLLGQNCTIPLLAFFSSHMPSVTENSPGTTLHSLQVRKWGILISTSTNHSQNVSVTFYGLIFLMNPLVRLVWVHAL